MFEPVRSRAGSLSLRAAGPECKVFFGSNPTIVSWPSVGTRLKSWASLCPWWPVLCPPFPAPTSVSTSERRRARSRAHRTETSRGVCQMHKPGEEVERLWSIQGWYLLASTLRSLFFSKGGREGTRKSLILYLTVLNTLLKCSRTHGVLVREERYNQVPSAEWDLNHNHLLSHSSGGQKSELLSLGRKGLFQALCRACRQTAIILSLHVSVSMTKFPPFL